MSAIDTSAHLNRWRKRALAEKALLAFGMLAIAVSVHSWQTALVIGGLMTVATIVGAGVSFGVWWQAMTAPISFLFIGVATVLFQIHGWRIEMAPNGLDTSVRLGARAFAGLNCLLFLALTTPAADLTAGLRRLGVPSEIVEMALLMYRFVFLLTDTAHDMNAAQAARLGHVTSRRRMESLGLLIVNLMPRALSRAQALEVGLAARGWRGELRVLSPVRPVSKVAITFILLLEAAVLALGIATS